MPRTTLPASAGAASGDRTEQRLLLVAAVALATLAIALTGCSAEPAAAPDSTPAADGAFPVTIEHAFGETTIEEAPERVVTWGWASTDSTVVSGFLRCA